MEGGVSTRAVALLARPAAVEAARRLHAAACAAALAMYTGPRRVAANRRIIIQHTAAGAFPSFFDTTDAIARRPLAPPQDRLPSSCSFPRSSHSHACHPPSRAFSILHIYRFVPSRLTTSQCIPYPTRSVFFMHVTLAADCSSVSTLLIPTQCAAVLLSCILASRRRTRLYFVPCFLLEGSCAGICWNGIVHFVGFYSCKALKGYKYS